MHDSKDVYGKLIEMIGIYVLEQIRNLFHRIFVNLIELLFSGILGLNE